MEIKLLYIPLKEEKKQEGKIYYSVDEESGQKIRAIFRQE